MPCSKLLALSEQLLELDAVLQRRVNFNICEMEGAFVACQINSKLAPILTLSSSTAFRLALTVQLILRYGGFIMQHHTNEALSKQYGVLANNAACQIATINRFIGAWSGRGPSQMLRRLLATPLPRRAQCWHAWRPPPKL